MLSVFWKILSARIGCNSFKILLLIYRNPCNCLKEEGEEEEGHCVVNNVLFCIFHSGRSLTERFGFCIERALKVLFKFDDSRHNLVVFSC